MLGSTGRGCHAIGHLFTMLDVPALPPGRIEPPWFRERELMTVVRSLIGDYLHVRLRSLLTVATVKHDARSSCAYRFIRLPLQRSLTMIGMSQSEMTPSGSGQGVIDRRTLASTGRLERAYLPIALVVSVITWLAALPATRSFP